MMHGNQFMQLKPGNLDKVQYWMQSCRSEFACNIKLPGNQINLIESFINWLL